MGDWVITDDQVERLTGASTLATKPATWCEFNMPDADYRDVGGVNQSFLKLMWPMPGSAVSFFNPRDTQFFRVGRYVHQATLTPHDPVPHFEVYPDKYPIEAQPAQQLPWNMGANYCQLYQARKRAQGIECFSRAEYAEMSGCVRSLARHPDVRELIHDRPGDAEVSLFATLELNGVVFRIKTRTDWRPRTGSSLVNIKTCKKGGSELRAFRHALTDEFYGPQAAVELTVHNLVFPDARRTEYVWPVVEKVPPYCVVPYETTWEKLAVHREVMWERLDQFSLSIRDRVFRGDSGYAQIL